MHLDLGIREVPIDVLEANPVRRPDDEIGRRTERIRVGIMADNQEELRNFERYLGKAKHEGLVSTDGRGQPMNKWRILGVSLFHRRSDMSPTGFILDLEEAN